MTDSGASSAGIYAALLQHSDDCISVLAADGRTVFQSPGVHRQLGYNPDELIGQSKLGLVHDDDRAAAEARLRAVAAGERIDTPLRLRCRHKDGSWRLLEVKTSRLDAPDGEPFVVLNSRDVTLLEATSAALRASDHRLGLALEIGGMGVCEFDFRTNQATFAESFARLLGYDDVPPGADLAWFLQHVHPEDRAHAQEAVEAGHRRRADFEVQFRVRRLDRAIRWWVGRSRVLRDASGEAVQAVSLVSDVTERRSLEDQVRQAQKLEAIGQLAGGIAHDFNNLLTVISGYAETLQAALPPDEACLSDLLEIRRAADRAAILTQQLLAFSRKQMLRPAVVDLNVVVREIATMIARLLESHIDLRLDLAPAPAPVLVDRGQLEQVLINLAVNARDAMPEGGQLEICTQIIEVTDAMAARLYPIGTGTHVCLSVRDTGTGMSPEVQARLFEPFFTTKEPGKGTGIGLSTVYGIVQQSSGCIFCTSEPGQGTTFDVYLPLTEPSDDDESRPEASAGQRESPAAAAATVLLVDEYRRGRELARRVLAREGYRVLTAGSAVDAAAIADQYDGSIELLVTDAVMPGMSGADLARHIGVTRPGLSVIYMSAAPAEMRNGHGLDPETSQFLEKPFTPAMLLRRVRAVLAPRDHSR